MKFKQRGPIVFMLILFIAAGQLNYGVYLPSMPAIAQALRTDTVLIQLSVTIGVIAFGLSALFYGPLSDYYGRRKIALTGMAICIVGSIVCVMTNHVTVLLIGRFIQGLGIGCSGVIGRATARDLYVTEKELVRAAAYISMAIALTPLVAPAIGGYLEEYFGWRSNFIFILAYAVFVFLLFLFLFPETNKHVHHGTITARMILSKYRKVLFHRDFLGFAFTAALALSGDLCYNIVAPFLLQEQLGVTPVAYGWLALLVAAGLVCGLFISTRLAHRVPLRRIIVLGLSIALIAGIGMLITAYTAPLHVISVIAPAFFYMMGVGLMYPGCSSALLMIYEKNAGIVSALFGGVQVVLMSIVMLIGSALPTTSLVPLAILLTSVIIGSAFAFFSLPPLPIEE